MIDIENLGPADLKALDHTLVHISEMIKDGKVPVLPIDPGWASDEQLAEFVECIEEYARLLGGTVRVIIER